MMTPATTPLLNGVRTMLFAPTITDAELTDAEKAVMWKLSAQLLDPMYQAEMALSELYYLGLNVVNSLGISIPPELEPLKAVLGWCEAGIDARTERLNVAGFRLPGQTEVDSSLQEFWQTNNLDAESHLAHEAALIVGRSYAVVGPREGGGVPLITIESARNMIGSWDPRTRALSAAYQTYRDADPASETFNQQLATLYTRQAIVQLRQDPKLGWLVQDRNDHQQGIVPAVQYAPRATLSNRLGRSAITNAWRNTQDRACRALQRMEVSGEFYATMKTFLLGVTEEQFKKADGSKATAWETFIGRISALKADEFGNLPQVETVPGQSPDGFVTSLDLETRIMSGHTGLAPHYLGIFSDGNPASADAIRMSDFRLKKVSDRLSVSFGDGHESLMRIALKVAGESREGIEQLETDWDYTGIPTPYADTESMARQVEVGMVPPDADDVLAYTGWTTVQRQRLAIQRKKTHGLAKLDNALDGLNQPGGGGQPADGQQPQALAALEARRATDGAITG
ncbi:hypothetical protein B1R94_26010 [Mycolicibacterium litorale]|nr:hypothetical protein B1R94_26010 [Mycolicibacterium litorale]